MIPKTIWEIILEGIAGIFTREELRRMGAGQDTLHGAVTGAMELPTLGESVATEEQRKRGMIVAYARSQLGVPYKLGAEVDLDNLMEKQSALDCAELSQACYSYAGISLVDGSNYQYEACQPVKTPQPGDLGFLWSDKWGRIGHVMIYAGGGVVIHALGGHGVIEDIDSKWETHPRWRGWRRHIDFARPPEDRTNV